MAYRLRFTAWRIVCWAAGKVAGAMATIANYGSSKMLALAQAYSQHRWERAN